MYHDFMHNGMFFMPGGFIFWIILLGIIFLIFNAMKDKKVTHNDNDEALNVAKKRFASGEISEEEYKKIKNTLFGKIAHFDK